MRTKTLQLSPTESLEFSCASFPPSSEHGAGRPWIETRGVNVRPVISSVVEPPATKSGRHAYEQTTEAQARSQGNSETGANSERGCVTELRNEDKQPREEADGANNPLPLSSPEETILEAGVGIYAGSFDPIAGKTERIHLWTSRVTGSTYGLPESKISFQSVFVHTVLQDSLFKSAL